MSKGSGVWKLVLAGAVISVAVSGGLYLSVPKSADVDLGVNKASGESYDRSLYGMPDVNMGHYKLDEDSYFKYKVDGTLDISRSNPSSVPNWLTDFEIWSDDEDFSEERVAFNEKRMKVLNKVGDIDAASAVESYLKDPNGESSEEEVVGDGEESGVESDSTDGTEGVEGSTSNYVGEDEDVTDVGGNDGKDVESNEDESLSESDEEEGTENE